MASKLVRLAVVGGGVSQLPAGAKPAPLEERTDLTPEVVKFYARHGFGMMPFFRKTELSDGDLDAIAAYLSRKQR